MLEGVCPTIIVPLPVIWAWFCPEPVAWGTLRPPGIVVISLGLTGEGPKDSWFKGDGPIFADELEFSDVFCVPFNIYIDLLWLIFCNTETILNWVLLLEGGS